MKFFTPENGTGAWTLGSNNMTVTSNNIVPVESPPPVKKPILFEKSATYFDNDMVPRRAHALLPRARIVSKTTLASAHFISLFIKNGIDRDSLSLSLSFELLYPLLCDKAYILCTFLR